MAGLRAGRLKEDARGRTDVATARPEIRRQDRGQRRRGPPQRDRRGGAPARLRHRRGPGGDRSASPSRPSGATSTNSAPRGGSSATAAAAGSRRASRTSTTPTARSPTPPRRPRIGRLAAGSIPSHCSVFLNIGTTTEAVARELVRHDDLSVVTNNLNVALALSQQTAFRMIVAGGTVRNRDGAVLGQLTCDTLGQFRVDYAVIGISGIDAEGTLLDFDYEEVRATQTVLAHAHRVFLVADHSKFGRRPMVRVGSLSQVHTLFTDRAPPAETRCVHAAATACGARSAAIASSGCNARTKVDYFACESPALRAISRMTGGRRGRGTVDAHRPTTCSSSAAASTAPASPVTRPAAASRSCFASAGISPSSPRPRRRS